MKVWLGDIHALVDFGRTHLQRGESFYRIEEDKQTGRRDFWMLGSRLLPATAKFSRRQAKVSCEAPAEGKRAGAEGRLATPRATEIINDTLRRCGQRPVERCRLGE